MYHIQPDLSPRKVAAVLRQIISKKGRLRCPHCQRHHIQSFRREGRYHCRSCRRKFSLLSGTWMKNVKIPLPLFIVLVSFWLEDVPIDLAQKLTGLSRPTLYRYYRLYRRHLVKTLEFKPQNNVQVDEAYFGRFKKSANYLHGWKTYQVAQKTCVAGISCPQTGQLATMVVPGKPGYPIREFISKHVPTDVTIYSDGSPIYTRLRTQYTHRARTHDLGFQTAYYIESCWSWMKRKLFKQYHHFTKEYAPEYVSELTFKFNTRKQEKNPFIYLAKSL
jgi:transposase-like protein